MTSRFKKCLRLAAWAIGGLLILVVMGWVFAPVLLVVDSGAQPADALVVLGGEPWTRPTRGAEVFQEVKAEMLKTETLTGDVASLSGAGDPAFQHFSVSDFQNFPMVIVSGNGDCQDVRRQMEARGVPHSVIEIEGESRSTQENALFSVKLLRAHHATNVVLVTSWYHSRRTLACFRMAAPEIHFYARPTVCPPAGVRHPDSYIVKRVFQEYAKIVYYRIFYGVSSFKN